MTEEQQIAGLFSVMISKRSPKTQEEKIALEQAFVNFQQMSFWLNAFDQMQSMNTKSLIHAG